MATVLRDVFPFASGVGVVWGRFIVWARCMGASGSLLYFLRISAGVMVMISVVIGML